MNNQSQFSLRWNNYVQHVTNVFRALRTQDDLVDVTLCCEGKKIKAHKVLLSACSTYFREIFKENPCQHPVVIFRNVKYEDLTAIIHFMYHGEVNILHEQLESFLMTAELLEVTGLTDSSEDEDEKSRTTSESWQPPFSKIDVGVANKTVQINTNTNSVNEEPINLAVSNFSKSNASLPSSINFSESSEQVRFENSNCGDSTMISNEIVASTSTEVLQVSEEMQVDNINQEESSDRNSNSNDDLAKFRCQLCPKGFKHPTSLTLHKDSHTGKTKCPVCYRSFSRSYDMRSHLQKIHQGKNLTIREIRYKDNGAPKIFNPQA